MKALPKWFQCTVYIQWLLLTNPVNEEKLHGSSPRNSGGHIHFSLGTWKEILADGKRTQAIVSVTGCISIGQQRVWGTTINHVNVMGLIWMPQAFCLCLLQPVLCLCRFGYYLYRSCPWVLVGNCLGSTLIRIIKVNTEVSKATLFFYP